METYGINLTERAETAAKYGHEEVAGYVKQMAELEQKGNLTAAQKDQVQACYDGLAACYSSTNGGKNWAEMNIALEALKA